MITWAFAYMLVNGVGVPLLAFIVTILVDLVMVSIIAEGLKGHEIKELAPLNKYDGTNGNGYQPDKPTPPGDE